jgi:hypothetical protein
MLSSSLIVFSRSSITKSTKFSRSLINDYEKTEKQYRYQVNKVSSKNLLDEEAWRRCSISSQK